MPETWYAVYRVDDGTLYSTGTVLADPLPAEFTSKILPEPPDFAVQEWDTAALEMVPRPPEVP